MSRSIAFTILAALFTALAFTTHVRADEPASPPPVDPESTQLVVHVIDEAGKPVPGAQAYLLHGMYRVQQCTTWQDANAEGAITFLGKHVQFAPAELAAGAEATLVIRAPGMAWATKNVTVPSQAPVKMTIVKGTPVTLAFTSEGDRALPDDFTPVVFTEGLSVAAWSTCVQGRNKEHGEGAKFIVAVPERTKPGEYVVHVPKGTDLVWALVHHPGYLRAHQAGPFSLAAMPSGRFNVTLPKPASLSVKLHPAEGKATEYTGCKLTLMAYPEIPDGGWAFEIYQQATDGKSLEASLNDMPPVNIGVVASTSAEFQWGQDPPSDLYQTQQWVELTAGDSQSLAFPIETFDEQSLRASLKGDHALSVKVTKPDGSPAAGLEYTLSFVLQQFARDLVVQSGSLPESGEFTVEGLPAGDAAMLKIEVDKNELGWVFIEPGEKLTKQSFSLPPGVGESAPDILLTRLDSDEKFSLSSLRGQVVFLDFWASWCGPCQEPMKHNNEMMARRTDWAGRAVILGASIDDEISTIKEHVNKHGWTSVLQAHCSEGEKGWACDAVKRYAVRGVPTCFLIDKEGKIAWSGHPMEINVEEKIDELIKQ